MFHRTATAAVAAALLLACTQAHAVSAITFVSTTGADTGNCTLIAPCKTIAFAISVTSAGGELHVLNSGFYGASATVDRSMTIDGGGNTVMQTHLVIDDGTSTATVVVRDLVLNGRGVVADVGINIQHAGVVQIERCTVERFEATGVVAFNAAVTLDESTVRDNGGAGMFFDSGSLVVNKSRFLNNGTDGLSIGAFSVVAVITDSMAAGNGAGGSSNGGFSLFGTVDVALDRATAFANKDGLRSITGNAVDPVVRISNSTFTANALGVRNGTGAGKMQSRQNSIVSGNTSNTSGGAPTAISAF